uniref:PID domain-containing protein n=1 Tax=Terrapene triunguis TaxID=2587831 RepID=A0A674JKR1_9SAUR
QRKKYSNFIMADVSQYTVNHLVTFPVGEAAELRSVEDAVRKVAAMEGQGQVWAQEMLLQVTGSAIRLLDVHSKEELESYGLAGVLRCEAMLPGARAHSLLLLVCQEPQQTQPDVHFFKCAHIGAEPIREDINSALLDFKSGSNAQRKEALRWGGCIVGGHTGVQVLWPGCRFDLGVKRKPDAGGSLEEFWGA